MSALRVLFCPCVYILGVRRALSFCVCRVIVVCDGFVLPGVGHWRCAVGFAVALIVLCVGGMVCVLLLSCRIVCVCWCVFGLVCVVVLLLCVCVLWFVPVVPIRLLVGGLVCLFGLCCGAGVYSLVVSCWCVLVMCFWCVAGGAVVICVVVCVYVVVLRLFPVCVCCVVCALFHDCSVVCW